MCNICGAKCRQPHTLREHFMNKHKKNVKLSIVKTLFSPQKIAQNSENVAKSKAKRVYEIFTCTCGGKIKSKAGFKRHVKNMHNSVKFDVFDKLKKMKKSKKKSPRQPKEQKNMVNDVASVTVNMWPKQKSKQKSQMLGETKIQVSTVSMQEQDVLTVDYSMADSMESISSSPLLDPLADLTNEFDPVNFSTEYVAEYEHANDQAIDYVDDSKDDSIDKFLPSVTACVTESPNPNFTSNPTSNLASNLASNSQVPVFDEIFCDDSGFDQQIMLPIFNKILRCLTHCTVIVLFIIMTQRA